MPQGDGKIGWSDFELSSGTYPYPLNAVRDGYGVVRKKRKQGDTEYSQRVWSLQYHVDVTSISTGGEVFTAYFDQEYVHNPTILTPLRVAGLGSALASAYMASPGEIWIAAIYNLPADASWEVQNIMVQDNGDGTSRVVTTLEYEEPETEA